MPIVKLLLRDFEFVFIALCLCILAVMVKKRLVKDYPAVAGMVVVLLLRSTICTGLLFYKGTLGIHVAAAYKYYFWNYWASDGLMAICQLLIIYSVFTFALKPLKGLHEIGKNVFRWVAAVSLMVSLAVMFGPHGFSLVAFSGDRPGMITALAQQVDQAIGILTLCLLLFVCFTTKPLGLTYRSRIFGILLGLGVMATTTLVQSAWSGIFPSYTLYSPIAVFGIVSEICVLSVWATYFVLPEPARKMILLPTASPYFYWNHVSEALGDEPGHVVVGGLTPAMFSEAEMAMFSAPDSDVANELLVTDFDISALRVSRFANAS
jgi:hypothetical protein